MNILNPEPGYYKCIDGVFCKITDDNNKMIVKFPGYDKLKYIDLDSNCVNAGIIVEKLNYDEHKELLDYIFALDIGIDNGDNS